MAGVRGAQGVVRVGGDGAAGDSGTQPWWQKLLGGALRGWGLGEQGVGMREGRCLEVGSCKVWFGSLNGLVSGCNCGWVHACMWGCAFACTSAHASVSPLRMHVARASLGALT